MSSLRKSKEKSNAVEMQAEFDREIDQNKQGAVILDEDQIDQENILGADFDQELAKQRQMFNQEQIKSEGDTDNMLEQTPTPKLQTKKQAKLKGQVSFKTDRRSVDNDALNSFEPAEISHNKSKSSRVLLNGSVPLKKDQIASPKRLNSPSISNVDKSNNERSNNDKSNSGNETKTPSAKLNTRKELSKTMESNPNKRVMFSDQDSEDLSQQSPVKPPKTDSAPTTDRVGVPALGIKERSITLKPQAKKGVDLLKVQKSDDSGSDFSQYSYGSAQDFRVL